jgi:hypothetical protein
VLEKEQAMLALALLLLREAEDFVLKELSLTIREALEVRRQVGWVGRRQSLQVLAQQV